MTKILSYLSILLLFSVALIPVTQAASHEKAKMEEVKTTDTMPEAATETETETKSTDSTDNEKKKAEGEEEEPDCD